MTAARLLNDILKIHFKKSHFFVFFTGVDLDQCFSRCSCLVSLEHLGGKSQTKALFYFSCTLVTMQYLILYLGVSFIIKQLFVFEEPVNT